MTLPELRPETELVEELEPSKVWKINFETGRLEGSVDGIEAVAQMAWLAIQIQRYKHLIFSWQVGNEQATLIGKDKDLIRSESERMIKDALSIIPYITEVRDFTFDGELVTFTIETVFGTKQMTRRA